MEADSADFFGWSVNIYGESVIVGAPHHEDSGSVYFFTCEGEEWTEQTRLNASDAEAEDRFGYTVSIIEDSAIIGAHGNNHNGNDLSGSAYIFIKEGDDWIERSKLMASDIGDDDGFGYFVSVSGDNAIVGSPGHSDDGQNSGAAYIYSGLGSLTSAPDNSGDISLPFNIFLSSPYPNPFNSTTTIEYGLPMLGEISLILYDLTGQQVNVIYNGRQNAGHHSLSLNKGNLSSGLYFIRLNTANQVFTQKVLLIR
ncbi:MAG: T9SS type A sorting domain-containing protein [Calditrichaeota bacterium]|jgi:hypothetical protein|nr:T9SS type A sorting domain-containing protein [Calditrichota bacterium]MBT7790589.1 T9SS type A sorting domain-containing protein [Calditrichota bacterium]